MGENLHESKTMWEATTLDKTLSRFPERRTEFKTESGIPVERLYTPDDVEGAYLHDLSFPGEYPFSRGIQPTMYRGRFWTMRQYAGFGSAQDTNARYKFLMDHGQTGLSVAVYLPTQIGYD